jgi:hypothetical protein
MSRANPKLLLIAGAMLAMTLLLKVVPSVLSTYSQLASDRENLRQELTYYQNLVEEEDDLKLRVEAAREELMGIETSVFGIPRNLLGSEVQAIIRNVSGRTGVEVREIRVADIEEFEDWFKVSQELSFVIEQRRIIPFLHALREYRPRLYIREFTVTRSRNQFIGSLTIEAFSRHSSDFD